MNSTLNVMSYRYRWIVPRRVIANDNSKLKNPVSFLGCCGFSLKDTLVSFQYDCINESTLEKLKRKSVP